MLIRVVLLAKYFLHLLDNGLNLVGWSVSGASSSYPLNRLALAQVLCCLELFDGPTFLIRGIDLLKSPS